MVRHDATHPLAYRMAPLTLDDYVGQRHLLAPGALLRRMIESDRLSSIVLFGPPGTGKTSLARVIAHHTKLSFHRLNAVAAGVADIKRLVDEAQNPLLTPHRSIVVFVDEIHRFNKTQQDALLPYVEDGLIVLIGATTENPFFTVNKALLSRSCVFKLEPLSDDDIKTLLDRAVHDENNGFGRTPIVIDDQAMTLWLTLAAGDARVALNALELAVTTTPPDAQGVVHVDEATAKACIQAKRPGFDRKGEGHYNVISALIKSIRGSDPNAALYYLARALYGGEDIAFLGRRLMIAAAEDVGLANPQMIAIAVACAEAAVHVGMPEARIPLAEAVVALATSPKSNRAYVAIDRALSDVAKAPDAPIPNHILNAPVTGMRALGYGVGYRYPHNESGAYVDVTYLPEALKDRRYYEPSSYGYEAKIDAYMTSLTKTSRPASDELKGSRPDV